jgi:hypothetical protein
MPIVMGIVLRACNSGAASATIAPGSDLSVKVVVSGGGGNIADVVRFGWRALTP